MLEVSIDFNVILELTTNLFQHNFNIISNTDLLCFDKCHFVLFHLMRVEGCLQWYQMFFCLMPYTKHYVDSDFLRAHQTLKIPFF